MGNKSGCLECFEPADYIIYIKTGDTKGSGLHNSADIVLINEKNVESRRINLSGCCVTVFKKGRTDKFQVKNLPNFGTIKRIIIEQHKEQNEVEWYIEKISIARVGEDSLDKQRVFPVNRWLRMNKPLVIDEFDTCLPQFDANKEQRENELARKRAIYTYKKQQHELPPQMCRIPRDEIFSNFYKWDILQKRADLFRVYEVAILEKDDSWRNFDEIQSLFTERSKKFRLPNVLAMGDDVWKTDAHFGRQRLRGCNPRSIRLCTEIPDNFAVCAATVKGLLDDFTLEEAIGENRMFIVDHSILDEIMDADCNQVIPSPMALFYLNDNAELMPVAIQLYQQKDEKENPVFTPNDPQYTWLLAKMWFNNADSNYQRMLLMTSSHWILECVTVSLHRNLSPSHPIHRLLQTYLRLILPINNFEMHALLNGHSNSWIDKNLTLKNEGMMKLIERYWKNFDFMSDMLEVDMTERDVLEGDVIPCYPYRDDALLLKQNIQDYVTQIIDGYYVENDCIIRDVEIQSLADELANAASCHLKNIPGNGEFACKEHLVQFITHVIFKVTVEHASLNLPLYDECAFVPNYPLCMRGKPPNSKDSLTEADIMAALPSKNTTMEILIINKLLSERDSSGLADSRAQYQFDPISLPARQRFLGQLRETAAVIDIRNSRRDDLFYDYLNPKASTRSIGHE